MPGSIGHSPSHGLRHDSPLSEGAKRQYFIVSPYNAALGVFPPLIFSTLIIRVLILYPSLKKMQEVRQKVLGIFTILWYAYAV